MTHCDEDYIEQGEGMALGYKELTERFDPVKFTTRHRIGSSTELREYRDSIQDSMFLELRCYVYGQTLQDETVTVVSTIEVPKTWWQHFKLSVFPSWLLKWLPVGMKKVSKEEKHTFRVRALFPDWHRESVNTPIGRPVYASFVERTF